MTKWKLMATATFGLESILGQEIKDLGYKDVQVENGKVIFYGEAADVCRANLWLRTADRVRLQVGEFKATTFEELFSQTRDLPWAEILPVDAEFPVDGKSVKSTLFSVSDCQAIVKKAIVESMKKKHKQQWFPENGPLYRIEVALLKDTVTLTVDTSGAGLHKRGYREQTGSSPLRENLAAAMIRLARWDSHIPLMDPFCGSGTIPIEAALMGCKIAPGLYRNFAAERWPQIPPRMWEKSREEAREVVDRERPMYILATDIHGPSLKAARKNAAMAGVEEKIHFQKADIADLSSRKKYGKVICNPPSAERQGQLPEVENLYRQLGRVLQKMDTWSYYILTSHTQFEGLFGSRASKKRKLYNGNILVHYYQYYGPSPPRGL